MLKIPRDSKILSISHNDLDGCGSQIVLGNVFALSNLTGLNRDLEFENHYQPVRLNFLANSSIDIENIVGLPWVQL